MTTLVAYIPVINRRHLEWFAKHPGSSIALISQAAAEELVPSLSRNMGALSTEAIQLTMSVLLKPVRSVAIIDPHDIKGSFGNTSEIVLANEDICHKFLERYGQFLPERRRFDDTFARWDMSAVVSAQPVLPDCEVSTDEVDIFRINGTQELTRRSPDWWRQIGLLVFRGTELLACGWNQHYPTEYETYMFGDPRSNFNAGDPAGMDAYVSLHAEEHVVAYCAENGIALKGASVYINTFPCGRCARVLERAGISELYFRDGSAFLKGFEILRNKGVRIVRVTNP